MLTIWAGNNGGAGLISGTTQENTLQENEMASTQNVAKWGK